MVWECCSFGPALDLKQPSRDFWGPTAPNLAQLRAQPLRKRKGPDQTMSGTGRVTYVKMTQFQMTQSHGWSGLAPSKVREGLDLVSRTSPGPRRATLVNTSRLVCGLPRREVRFLQGVTMGGQDWRGRCSVESPIAFLLLSVNDDVH